ncbi:MAG: DUF6514 family protein [Firmicutes bacterium]|nr:DUF6514 family protein [Bacillota bacterium]
MDRRSVAQSYVMTPDGSEFRLKYHLAVCRGEGGDVEYGVKIEEFSAGGYASETRYFAEREDEALEVIDLLADGFVFPYTLDEILEDLVPAAGRR